MFQIAEDDQNIATRITKIKDDIFTFSKKQPQEHQPRDHYKKLLELTSIFVGGVPNSGIKF